MLNKIIAKYILYCVLIFLVTQFSQYTQLKVGLRYIYMYIYIFSITAIFQCGLKSFSKFLSVAELYQLYSITQMDGICNHYTKIHNLNVNDVCSVQCVVTMHFYKIVFLLINYYKIYQEYQKKLFLYLFKVLGTNLGSTISNSSVHFRYNYICNNKLDKDTCHLKHKYPFILGRLSLNLNKPQLMCIIHKMASIHI